MPVTHKLTNSIYPKSSPGLLPFRCLDMGQRRHAHAQDLNNSKETLRRLGRQRATSAVKDHRQCHRPTQSPSSKSKQKLTNPEKQAGVSQGACMNRAVPVGSPPLALLHTWLSSARCVWSDHSQEGSTPSPPSLKHSVGRAASPVVHNLELLAIIDVAAFGNSDCGECLSGLNACHPWGCEEAVAAALVHPYAVRVPLQPFVALRLLCMTEVCTCKLLQALRVCYTRTREARLV